MKKTRSIENGKLRYTSETVRTLSSSELTTAAGGGATLQCSNWCLGCNTHDEDHCPSSVISCFV